jgi:N-acetylglucosamine-6-phosphate deacetylase
LTHVFNAMAPLHHREPGLAGAALDEPGVSVGVIVDGVHLSPTVVRLLWRLLGSRRTLLVSDSVAALGAPGGTLGPVRLEVGPESVRAEAGQLAGSLLSLDQAVRNLQQVTGCEATDAVSCATAVPAALLKARDRGHLRPGGVADLTVLSSDLQVLTVVTCGFVTFGADLWNW